MNMNTLIKTNSSQRVDSKGRAYAGSQRWIQEFVCQRADLLNNAILQALPSLSVLNPGIDWVSPLEADGFAEYYDERFLVALGVDQYKQQLRTFWPRRGPHWDALARIHFGNGVGAILVEAKSYPAELLGSGCQASPRSRAQIETAFCQTKRWLGADPTADWYGPLYQSANRLAHLYFLREIIKVPAWLVHVCFVADPRTPTPVDAWRPALAVAEKQLGLSVPPPFATTVFLSVENHYA